jgi:repressor LexA
MELTTRQQEILDLIRTSFREAGVAPTCAEIAAHFGFASPATVTSHLDLLEKKGAIRRGPGHGRTIQLSEPVPPRRILDVPLLGAIPAGFPREQELQSDRFISIDADAIELPRNARTFALKVQGDSMIGAGILDGDVVILEHGVPAHHGDIVAAAIDGEMTLKRLVLKDRKPFLKAENPKYQALTPAYQLVIEGVFRGLIRLSKKVA